MLAYKYRARDGMGVLVQGRLEAVTPDAALKELVQRGYFVSDLELDRDVQKRDFDRLKIKLTQRSKVSARDLAVFTRQFGVLYAAGIPILPALTAIRQQQGEPSPLGAALSRLEQRLIGGDSLALSMRDDAAFPQILVSMVAAGEVGGALDESLMRATAYFEREHQVGQKVKSALTYPKFVGIMALAITWFLLASIVPNFASIFSSFDMELPGITRFMLNLSDFIVRWSWLLLLVIACAYLLYRRWQATDRGKSWLGRVALRLPIFGQMISMNAISRFCRTLAALTRSGVNVVSSLQLAGQTVDNSVFIGAIQQAATGIGRGNRLAYELEQTGLFPPMMLHMVQVGENSGSLDTMLNQMADFYDQDLNTLTDRLGKLIEPIVLLVMALVVGMIALSIALPMMQMVNIVQF